MSHAYLLIWCVVPPNGLALSCGADKFQFALNRRSPITVTHEVCFYIFHQPCLMYEPADYFPFRMKAGDANSVSLSTWLGRNYNW